MKRQLGETLRLIRKSTKTTQVRLAEILKLHQTAICRIECGRQHISPEELYRLSSYFGIGLDDLFSNSINFWDLASRFGRKPPYPSNYIAHPYSTVRESLPIFLYLNKTKGSKYTDQLLDDMKMPSIHLANPNQPIGVNFNIDLLRKIIKNGLVNADTLPNLIAQTRVASIHGALDIIYKAQENGLELVQTRILNAPFYESNFYYEIHDLKKKQITFSIQPRKHMQEVNYKDSILRDFLCTYKKHFFAEFPRYIDQKPLSLKEKECHFHGKKKCVYEITLKS